MWYSLWFLCHVLESNLSTFGFGNTTGVTRNNFPMFLSQRKKSWSCEQIYQGFAEAVPKNCLTKFPNNIDIINQQSFSQYVCENFLSMRRVSLFLSTLKIAGWRVRKLLLAISSLMNFVVYQGIQSDLPLSLWNSTLWLQVSLTQLSFFLLLIFDL